MTFNARKTFFQIHLWTGIGVGLFLLIASVTGAMLGFYPEIKDALHKELFHVPMVAGQEALSVDALIAKLKADHPEVKASAITFYGGDRTAIVDLAAKKGQAYLNPYTGEELQVGDVKRGDFLRQVEYFHRFLLAGKTGKAIVDFATLCGMLLLGTGIYLWWPSTVRKLKKAFTMDWKKKGRGWWINIHEFIGIYSAVVVFILCFTAMPLSYGWFTKAVFFKATGSAELGKPPKSRPAPAGAKRVPMQLALDRLLERIPSFTMAREYFPKKPNDPYFMYAMASDAPHNNARSFLYVDAYTGEVLRYDPYDGQSFGQRMFLWTLPLHQGQVGGVIGRLIAMTGSLAMAALAVTGAWMYYRRKLRPLRRSLPSAAQQPARQKEAVAASARQRT